MLGRKRSDFGMGAFLVGTKKSDSWVSLAKIGTGLTDEEFRETRRRLEEIKIKEKREDVEVEGNLVPDVWVEPKIIVEIAADEITISPNHAGGIALRFPRLIKFRDDKGPEQVTTWKEVLRIGKI
jgi:DNA ligase-1